MTKTFRVSDEAVSHYSKTVEISDTGMVTAEVFAHAVDGHKLRRVGVAFFTNHFNSIEIRCKKAHNWANERIVICKYYEVQYAQVISW